MDQLVSYPTASFSPVYFEVPKVYIIHENEEWVAPLWHELDKLGIPYENWFIDEGGFDLEATPPEGIFYNRMSASSHTRGHRYAVELSNPIIHWLEAHGRKVINGHQTINTEVNKAKQHILLNAAGLKTPKTYIANSPGQTVALARNFGNEPFIVKPNRGGKGLGVQLFHSVAALELQLEQHQDIDSLDGIFLVQAYIKPPTSEIVRMEFIGGKFYYAVAVDTSEGFELCPADACAIDDLFCPTVPGEKEKPKFQIIKNFRNPDLPKIEAFLAEQKIDIAGIEFVQNEKGERFIYDINTNTNYNSAAEEASSFEWKGMREVAAYLQTTLQEVYS